MHLKMKILKSTLYILSCLCNESPIEIFHSHVQKILGIDNSRNEEIGKKKYEMGGNGSESHTLHF